MKITLTRSESSALNNLRGLPEDVHFMVMRMSLSLEGGVLDGDEETLEALVEFVSGELADGMVPNKHVGALTSLCVKIDPGCIDWLGM